MVSRMKQLLTSRDLIWAWTYRIIRARYQQSVLGGLWAIVQPAASAAIFSLIFTFFIPVNTGNIPYLVFSYTAMVPWTLFSSAVSDMVDSLVSNMNLVSKIYFPREILPLTSLLARLVDFSIAFVIVALLIFVFRVPVLPIGWLLLPVILMTQLLFALGLGLVGAALNVFYRDVKHILTLGLQIWFYASPIIYPVAAVPERFRSLYFANPMAGIIEAYRAVLLRQELPGPYLLFSASMAIVTFLVGYWFFKRVEFQFADVV